MAHSRSLRLTQLPQLVLLALLVGGVNLAFGDLYVGDPITALIAVSVLLPIGIHTALFAWRSNQLWMSLFASVAGFFVLVNVVLIAPETGSLLAGAENLTVLREGIQDGWRRLLSMPLPAPSTAALVLPVSALTWLTAAASTEAVLRTRNLVLPLAPVVIGVSIATALGTQVALADGVPALVALFIAGLFVVARSTELRLVADRPMGWSWKLTRTEIAQRVTVAVPFLVIIVVLTAVVAAPVLPRGDHYDPREDQELPVEEAVTVNPLAEVVGAHDEDDERVLFTADVLTSDDDAHLSYYWRLVTLDHYDGSAWRSTGEYVEAAPILPLSPGLARDSGAIEVAVTIEELDSPWLPVIERPVSLSIDEFRVDVATGDLLAGPDAYPKSYVLVFEPVVVDGLSDASSVHSGMLPDLSRYLQLPGEGDEMDKIRELADQAAGAYTADSERLMALRIDVRERFTQDADEGQTGHSLGHLDDLLNRSAEAIRAEEEQPPATPEQVAALFAVMARSVGLPTRVVVGYAPQDSGGSEVVVTNNDAHVWPEVALADMGWVPVPVWIDEEDAAQQELEERYAEALEEINERAENEEPPTDLDPAPVEPVSDDEGIAAWVVLLVTLLFTTTIAVAAVTMAKARRRKRRRERESARLRVIGAWDEATDRLREANYPLRSWMTATEVAELYRARTGGPTDNELAVLARLTNMARFAPEDVSAHDADVAWEQAEAVRSAISSEVSAIKRARHLLDPRPLVRARAGPN